MEETIRILHLEDDPADAELVRTNLASAGLSCRITLVQTRDEFSRALHQGGYDIILGDYRLPAYDGMSGLKLSQARCPDIPFIFVSGVMGEDAAIEGLTQGATDYVLKQKLSRLPAAVTRALRDAENRRERRRAEDEVRRTRDELEERVRERTAELSRQARLLDLSRDAIIVRDHLSGAITFWNTGAEALYGWSRDEVLGRVSHEVIHTEYPEPLEDIASQLSASGRWEGELRQRKKDGSEITVSARWVLQRDDAAHRPAVMETNTDVTEQRRLEEHLRQSQKLEGIGTLAGGIAHDFNNILAIIMGNTEIALDTVDQENPAHRPLEQSMKACLRAKRLVQQILTFSRRVEPERKPVQLARLVNETFALLRSTLPATIAMTLNVRDQSGTIIADSQLIQQTLLNLVTNARDAIGNKLGAVEVGVAAVNASPGNRFRNLPSGEYMMLSVKDTGSGMDERVVARIFEPFFTTKEVGHGTGMGLAVVHGIVEGHNGVIDVESAPGKGTVMRVFFPRVAPVPSAEEGDVPGETTNGTVLFIDDEEELVVLAKERLQKLGYDVVAETDPIMALRAFIEEPNMFDLVITDQTMPHMSGLELARELLDIRPTLPIILCTGYSEAVSAQSARKDGIEAVLMKPVERRELAEVIGRVLRKSRKTDGKRNRKESGG
ncbi:MAG: response regulator [Syntrophorhabdales bacterium]|jgi:PAS domain S-box-containing protein